MALFSPIVLTADVPLRMQSVIYSGKWLATMTRAGINPMSSICILAGLQSFPGWLLSRVVIFPDETFPGKTS